MAAAGQSVGEGVVGLAVVGLAVVGLEEVGLDVVGLGVVGDAVVGLGVVGDGLVGDAVVGLAVVGDAVVGLAVVGLAVVGLAVVGLAVVGLGVGAGVGGNTQSQTVTLAPVYTTCWESTSTASTFTVIVRLPPDTDESTSSSTMVITSPLVNGFPPTSLVKSNTWSGVTPSPNETVAVTATISTVNPAKPSLAGHCSLTDGIVTSNVKSTSASPEITLPLGYSHPTTL